MEWTRRTCLHIWVVVPLNAKGLSGHLLHTAHLSWSMSSSLILKYFQISDLDLDGTYMSVVCGKLIDSSARLLEPLWLIINGVNALYVSPHSWSCTSECKRPMAVITHSPNLAVFIVSLEIKVLPNVWLGSGRCKQVGRLRGKMDSSAKVTTWTLWAFQWSERVERGSTWLRSYR